MYNELMLKDYPEMMGSVVYEDNLKKAISIRKSLKQTNTKQTSVVVTIPVVVHVLHNGEDIGLGSNISDAQILSQIDVLNQDFRRQIGTPGYNDHPDGADIEIEFCLVQKSPEGCPTNGIDRIDIGQDGVVETDQEDGYTKVNAFKPSTIWDPSSYLNIWTVAFNGGSGLLGYAQLPGGNSETDGVVINYKHFGSINYDDGSFSLNGPYNEGRTTTHEIGHFLGLYHTFQGGCSGENANSGDFCEDTPAVSEANYNCPVGVDSCPNSGGVDMIENYMDYTQDSCMNIFTQDQKDRMLATLATEINRSSLITSDACSPPASVDDDCSILIQGLNFSDCSQIAPQVRLTNYGSSTMASATISYQIDSGAKQVFNWSGSLDYLEEIIVDLPIQNVALGNHNLVVSVSNPNGNVDARDCNNESTVNFDTAIDVSGTSMLYLSIIPDDYGSEITWEFDDGVKRLTGGPYTDGDRTEITRTFSLRSDGCYTFKIMDSAGDGICCGEYGDGSYQLTDDQDNIVVSGGSYGDEEITSLSALTLSLNDYFSKENIKIYPNPASNTLNISLGITSDLPDGYEIYSALGQKLRKSNVVDNSDLNINTSQLKSGLYFIRIEKEGYFVSYPFVKN
ncbi:M43 family zinc metalloprotease [Aestuariibaculum lutulentum]|uniref:T9SS type A sorting domain-containing protein n=2 Tax=Aestuariibaculum lutulentum TaxID=2920935 RepID=A0ABS9RHA1_9FLAO|nr:M43 family zinc metalloprotease [Aestuariibaculum lutulentum]MCH4552333.1 T9SS type A sorting domain-containing protein [Aestuariibaculum lutulentum]